MTANLRLVEAPRETLDDERDRLARDAMALLTTDRSGDPGTGFRDLDQVLGPFTPGKLVVALARPGIGKTTFAMGVASRRQWIERGFVYFPTEEEGAAALLRHAATVAGVHPGSAVDGLLSLDLMRRVADTRGQLARRPCYFRDRSRPTVAHVAEAATEARAAGVGLVIVDHAHRMALAERESERVSLEQTIRALKDVAVRERITLLVMAQARRRHGELDRYTCPQLDEALGTSVFDQEADTVLGIYRPMRTTLEAGRYREINEGRVPLGDVLMPETMGVRVLKFRRNGDRVGARVLLHCADGLLSDRRGGA
jgi:replicative DNA helicase